jgi:YVTN family beta-propeller protein
VVYRSIEIEKGVPTYAAINSNTNTAYISYTSSDFIIVVNLEKGTIENKIQLTCPGNICINRVTNKVYASSAYGICEIDGVNNHYDMINIGIPHSDGSVDVNPLTNLLYTTCFGHDILTVIDAATQAIADKVPVGKNAKGVAVDTKMNKIYVANYDSYSISVIDCYQ